MNEQEMEFVNKLRDKLEKYKDGETGCKYCNEYEDLPEHYICGEFVGKVFDTSIDRDENGWHIELSIGADIGIRYCPFCGRELT